MKSSNRASWLALLLPILAAPRPALAGNTAVQSGNWGSAATWGGALPASCKDILIPAGITVTVASGTSVTFDLCSGGTGVFGGVVRVSGPLVVAGTLSVAHLESAAGGALTVNGTGSLSVTNMLITGGPVVNKGVMKPWAPMGQMTGSIANEAGATFNPGGATLSISGAFTNRGTFSNEGLDVTLYGPFENYGTLTNGRPGVARALTVKNATLRNYQGAKIASYAGNLKIDASAKVVNDGTIENSNGIVNYGSIVNTCTGVFTGTPLAGNQPTLDCPGGTPVPVVPPTPAPGEWPAIPSPGFPSRISVGSASRMTGSVGGMLLTGSTTGLSATSTPMAQASIGADGTWWGIKADGTVWRLSGSAWTQVAGTLSHVSIGSASNIWGVNSVNNLYRWNGTTWISMGTGTTSHVSAAADGTVWAITAAGGIARWTGSGFASVSGSAVEVAAGSASNVWVRNSAGSVFKWTGSTWQQQSDAGTARAIAAGADGTVAVVRSDGTIYRKP